MLDHMRLLKILHRLNKHCLLVTKNDFKSIIITLCQKVGHMKGIQKPKIKIICLQQNMDFFLRFVLRFPLKSLSVQFLHIFLLSFSVFSKSTSCFNCWLTVLLVRFSEYIYICIYHSFFFRITYRLISCPVTFHFLFIRLTLCYLKKCVLKKLMILVKGYKRNWKN